MEFFSEHAFIFKMAALFVLWWMFAPNLFGKGFIKGLFLWSCLFTSLTVFGMATLFEGIDSGYDAGRSATIEQVNKLSVEKGFSFEIEDIKK